MRRYVSPLLVGLGAFLLIAAVLVRAYVYPSMAKVPSNYESVTTLEGKGVEVFNIALLKPVVTDLYTSSATTAQAADDIPEGCVLWANTTSTRTGDPRGVIFQRSADLSTFDEVTGAACEGGPDFVESTEGERTAIQRSGQIYKLPFNTGKRDYEWWDGSIGEATTMAYVGTGEIEGLDVYEFNQVIEPTVTGSITVPGSVFGTDDPAVEAESVYAMDRTLFVEPNTGVVVQRVEERDQVLRYDGTEVSAFVGTVQYSQDAVDETVAEYSTTGALLGAARLVLPLLLGLLGIALVVAGVLLGRRPSRQAPTRAARTDELVGA